MLTDTQLYLIVENTSFKHMLDVTEPSYNVPSHQHSALVQVIAVPDSSKASATYPVCLCVCYASYLQYMYLNVYMLFLLYICMYP